MKWNSHPLPITYITNTNPNILMGHEERIGYIKPKIATFFFTQCMYENIYYIYTDIYVIKQTHGMKSVIAIDTSIYDDTGAARS